MKIIIVNSHPIQYFAPLYAFLCKTGLPIEVIYCSGSSLEGAHDKEFNTNVKWDLPMLEGYPHTILKNNARRPSFFRFWGVVNWQLANRIKRRENAIYVLHGWQFFSYVYAFVLCKIRRKKVCFRLETPYNQEMYLKGYKAAIKKMLVKWVVLPLVDYFMYIGEQNKQYYLHMGVPEAKLIFTPYAVDNERFGNAYAELHPMRSALRKRNNIPDGARVIMFCGKFISKKRPMDLLEAYVSMRRADTWLVFVGEGELRPEMESFIQQHNIHQVVLTGFVNQLEISEYYAMADVFVMCSGDGETWGLSVNEAMNFALPLVVYDRVGAAIDLVQQNWNGEIVPFADTIALANAIERILYSEKDVFKEAGTRSRERVQKYSYASIRDGFLQLLAKQSNSSKS